MGSKLIRGLLAASITVLSLAVPTLASIDWGWNGIPTNQKELDKALSAYQQGDADAAIAILNGMKSGTSGDPRAQHILSDIYREQKRYSEAKKELQDLCNAFTQYIGSHSVSPPWMDPSQIKVEIGNVAAEEGNFSEAMSIYRDTEALSPKSVAPKAAIGRLYEMQGDLENAKIAYKSILDMPTLSAAEKGPFVEKCGLLDREMAAKAAATGQPPGMPNTRGGPQRGPGGQPGMQQGMQPGMQAGMQPGMQPGMQQGMQPGRGAGMSSVQTGYRPATQSPSGAYGMSTAAKQSHAGTGPLQVAADEIATRKYEAAITRLKAVVAKEPANAQAHYLLAVAYASSHQSSSAKGEYEATLKYAQDMRLQKMASAGLSKLLSRQGQP